MDYKKMALKFVGKYCNALQAQELREETTHFFIYVKCARLYTGCENLELAPELNSEEKSYLSKVVKGLEQGALYEAKWF